MVRFLRLLVPFLTAVIVLLLAAIHANVHHYEVTAEPRFKWLLVLVALLWITTYAVGVSEVGITSGARLLRSAGASSGAVAMGALLQLFITRRSQTPISVDIGVVIALTPALVALNSAIQRSMRLQGPHERVVALVDVEERERLTRDISIRPEQPSRLALAVSPADLMPGSGVGDLEKLVADHRATLVVLNREAQSLDEIVSQAASVHSHGVRIRTLSLFYDEWLGKLPLSELERIALLFDINEIHRPVYARLKRFTDVVLAIFGFPVLALLVPLVALANFAGNRGPLFFHQERVGKDGKIFTIYKFRTMRPHEGPADWTLPDDERIGKVGRFLRKSHLDELPQVLNVLRRDLSVVGPRPEQPRYVNQLSIAIPFYEVRHLVRPGITGWAQIKYDYGATEQDALEKLQYEFYYLRHQSLALDMRIIGRTLRSIVGRQGR